MNKVLISFKLLYLYLLYWFVGLTQEDFYITKGGYFADLGNYYSAIKCYEKSIKDTENYFVYSLIGWCYFTVEDDDNAIKYYRKAYKKIKSHYVTIILSFLEMEMGNIDECEDVFKHIKEKKEDLHEESMKLYNQVADYLKKNRIETEQAGCR